MFQPSPVSLPRPGWFFVNASLSLVDIPVGGCKIGYYNVIHCKIIPNAVK